VATSAIADPDSVNGRLADFLCTRKEEMIRAWIEHVHTDASIPAEGLTTNQLRDHLPRLFDDLADSLRSYGTDHVAAQVAKDAAKHGSERWQQGYDVAQVLREIMHLRGVFIYHLRIFEELNADFGMAARLFANATVHRFLDEISIAATEQFLASQRQALREASGLA
jgi:hypothetical protein